MSDTRDMTYILLGTLFVLCIALLAGAHLTPGGYSRVREMATRGRVLGVVGLGALAFLAAAVLDGFSSVVSYIAALPVLLFVGLLLIGAPCS